MLKHRKIGELDLFLINEFTGPTHDRDFMLPDSTWGQMIEHRALLENRYWLPLTDRLIFTQQIFVLKHKDAVVLIDTAVGNFKSRNSGWQHKHNLPTLDYLKGVGAGPDDVTDIVITHLHADHVGWNTIPSGNGWAPAFPNAVYHAGKVDYDDMRSRFEKDRSLQNGSFADSVVPIVEVGLMQFYRPGDRLTALEIEVFEAPGHTPGQSGFVLRHDGETVIFSADVFHSPLQVYYPDINSRWCELPEHARGTRKALLERALEPNTVVMPAHSFTVDGWKVSRSGEGYRVLIEN